MLSLTKIACATAVAGALVGHASAFAVPPSAAALRAGAGAVQAPSLASQRPAHGDLLSLRASGSQGNQNTVPDENKFGLQVDSDTITIDPSGYSQVEVKGDYLEDGWSDESASSGGGGGWFAGMFAKKPTKSLYGNAPKKSPMQMAKELDVIEYTDGTKGSLEVASKAGTAVPFGGLNPSQIDTYRKAKEAKEMDLLNMPEKKFIMYPDGKGGQTPVKPQKPVPPQAPGGMPSSDLMEGWYSAYDESSQSEYYYNDQGATTWEKPVATAK
mmetsp:Transcript_22117/g.55477  ORF Transcript_22117/g.55477 Transcript_22117/m.55477 type:complete len:270 (+) Transcript_22117:56-865(+)